MWTKSGGGELRDHSQPLSRSLTLKYSISAAAQETWHSHCGGRERNPTLWAQIFLTPCWCWRPPSLPAIARCNGLKPTPSTFHFTIRVSIWSPRLSAFATWPTTTQDCARSCAYFGPEENAAFWNSASPEVCWGSFTTCTSSPSCPESSGCFPVVPRLTRY